jgi:hypothetical protein
MPYWQLVTRSFAISWRHKYLWLLALFAGEGGGFSFNYSERQSVDSRGNVPNFTQQISDWASHNLGLIAIVAVVWIILVIAFFVLAAVCEGALVRASAEHDAERPFGLGIAWRCGVATMGTIIRFRLLLIGLVLPVVIVFFALLAGFLVAVGGRNVGAAVGLGIVGLLIIFAAIPYAIYLYFLDRLGTRAAVLEQLGARAAIVRGHRLLMKRLGRAILVLLVAIATGIVVGICLAVVLGILALPLILIGAGAYAAGSPALWVVVAIGVVILLPIVLTVEGFVIAQGSTYWTLAFRRMEIDQAPAYRYPYPQAAPPQGAV